MKTRWTCESCGKTAVVNHHKHVDLWSVFVFIENNHALVSSGCEFDIYKVRVTVEEVPVA